MPERADELKQAVALAVLGFVSATCASIAQEVVSPEDYVRSAEGKTITYRTVGTDRLLGVEQYLGDGRTIWRARGEPCTFGQISFHGPQLCFTYETEGVTSCWLPFRIDGQLHARSVSVLGSVVYRAEESTEPLECDGVPVS